MIIPHMFVVILYSYFILLLVYYGCQLFSTVFNGILHSSAFASSADGLVRVSAAPRIELYGVE